ncbi:vitrin-like, partial [Oculina patagonica]
MRTSPTESSQKNDVIQLLKTRKAFAAAKRAVRKNVVKRSSRRDFLKKVTSLIKEKEDESIKSSVCRPSVDLAFVIDGCGRKPFHVCTDFVKNFIKGFSFPKSKTRVGVILYSRKAKLLFGFNYFRNAEDSFDALNRIRFTLKQPGKPENIGSAMTKAHDMLFSGSRMGVPKVLVVITAARANDDIINPSNRLRNDGVVICAVGFGNDFDRSQLE